VGGERAEASFVQMFEVALLARMCCSRVASVSTKPRWPRNRRLSSEPSAGILPHELVAAKQSRRQRPARSSGQAETLASIATMSASVGGLDEAEGNTFAIATTTSRPAACVTSREGRRTIDHAEKVRACTTTAATSSLTQLARLSHRPCRLP